MSGVTGCQQVINGLYIGDYQSSQDDSLLDKLDINAVLVAMRQGYSSNREMLRIEIDDTDQTNIIAHFAATNDFIRANLHQNILVHCQAGVSRSTTLIAAFLMHDYGLNAEEALEKIRIVRPQIQPTEAFLNQLEMYERCECEWNPVKWIEQRRFLMGFAQAQILDGTSPSIVLAYYPSPSPSPRSDPHSVGLQMTPMDAANSTSNPAAKFYRNRTGSGASTSTMEITPLENGAIGESPSTPLSGGGATPQSPTAPSSSTPMRKRLTARGATKQLELDKQKAKVPEKKAVEKIGTKAEVVVVGKRIRCKMCRRELAARDHILVHEVGKGQQAFAPHRRDMAAHRAEQERRRLDQLDKEKREAAAASASDSTTASAPALSENDVKTSPQPQVATASLNGGNNGLPAALAGLRIARPLQGPGLRVAVPNPRAPVPRPVPVPKSDPSSNSMSPDSQPPLSSSSEPLAKDDDAVFNSDSSDSDPDAGSRAPTTAAVKPEQFIPPSPDLPLLPSHLCSSYFVEPLSWMSPTLENGELSGRIVCPNGKCGAKLGSYDWAGLQCSCGAWVLPGFALNVSRVDEFKPAQN
ncbi:DSPc-domain-containing protein [Meredithblackwellia eburnea MCA 4105]